MTLEECGAAIGAARAGMVTARLAAAAADLPAVRVEQVGDAVRLSGRRLRARIVDEPLLRVPGALP